VTLLVLYTLPESLSRLVNLATSFQAYAKAGARVIAVQVDGAPAADALSSVPRGASVLATAGADVAAAYALFAPKPDDPGERVPAHAEYLIDRQGQLRVRWIGIPASPGDRGADTLAQIGVLVREPPRPLAQWGHRH
jgi:peroxiredoxin